MDENGKLRRSLEVERTATLFSSPATVLCKSFEEPMIIVASSIGKIYAFLEGHRVGLIELGGEIYSTCAVCATASEMRLLVGSRDEHLYALSISTSFLH